MNGLLQCNRPFQLVLVLVALVLLLVLVLILVLVLVVLILLVIHNNSSKYLYCGQPASVAFPENQDLSFALKIRLAIKPLTTAAVIPPAVAFKPPMRIPRKPSVSTASRTPFARQ